VHNLSSRRRDVLECGRIFINIPEPIYEAVAVKQLSVLWEDPVSGFEPLAKLVK
jgi:hypothetical protein